MTFAAQFDRADTRPLILLVLTDTALPAVRAQLKAVAELAPRCQCRIRLAGDDMSRAAALNRDCSALLETFGLDPIAPLGGTLTELRHAVLSGAVEGVARVTLLSDLSYLSPSILGETDAVVVGQGATQAPAGVALGCTLVTSVFRSDTYIRGFINNSAALTGYATFIDHLFLVAKLSALEIAAFQDLMVNHRNAIVHWNRTDPGLYNCWNQGIRMARRDYVSNANVDDLRAPDHVMALVQDLEARPECAVAASGIRPFYDFPADGALPEIDEHWYGDEGGYFDAFRLMRRQPRTPPFLESHNLPHCMPVWRRVAHDRYGWFDEDYYGPYADWAFWVHLLMDGQQGWLNPEPLGYYFINLDSHNRRGDGLARSHDRVEREMLGPFVAREAGLSPHAARPVPAQVTPKLALGGRSLNFGDHRHSFNSLIDALRPLEQPDGEGVLFVPFVERQFVWGDAPGEAASEDPQPITRPWIGILHVPFEAPAWFMPEVSPETFFASELWQRSRPHCRGIICLARDLEADLNIADPDLPTLAVWHPTSFDAALFDPRAYRAQPRVVQVGDWLRKLQAIHRLRAPGHQRIMLEKLHTALCLDREIAQFGDMRDPEVDTRYMIPNEEYDALLSSSVVLCLLYGTAANNVVIECIARATPMLINPLPAVVEYLGRDYPLYVRDEAEADAMLATEGAVEAAHAYLLRRRQEIDLSYDGFCRDIATSGLYAGL